MLFDSIEDILEELDETIAMMFVISSENMKNLRKQYMTNNIFCILIKGIYTVTIEIYIQYEIDWV